MSKGNETLGKLTARNVNIILGTGSGAVHAIQGISAEIGSGEIVSLLGPSGCGKSTLLGAIAGFTPLHGGEILLDGNTIKRPGAERGIVFQHHNLFPWKSVQANVEFGLKMRGISKIARKHLAEEILDRVGLTEFSRHFPDQLSGGMQQRVNLARVLVNRPNVLLMDEPFSALDAQTRLDMQEMLLDLWAEFRMTILFVTHDVDEAVILSDRVLVLSRRPAQIKAEIPVLIDRPRPVDVTTSTQFMHLKRACMDTVRGGTPINGVFGDTTAIAGKERNLSNIPTGRPI